MKAMIKWYTEKLGKSSVSELTDEEIKEYLLTQPLFDRYLKECSKSALKRTIHLFREKDGDIDISIVISEKEGGKDAFNVF